MSQDQYFKLLDALLEQYDAITLHGPRGDGSYRLAAKPLTDPTATINIQGVDSQDVLEQLQNRRGR